MTARSFAVETRGQGIVVFGPASDLEKNTIHELQTRGIVTISGNDASGLTHLRQTHDIDFVLLFQDAKIKKNFAQARLIQATDQSKIILVKHVEADTVIPENQVDLLISHSDYIGEGEYESPLLEGWLDTIQKQQTIFVKGDGLATISLIALNDLARLISLATTSPSLRSTSTIELGNPQAHSVLNLAYLVRTSLPFKVDLRFIEGGGGGDKTINIPEYAASLNKLQYDLRENPEIFIKDNFSSLPTKPVTPTAPVKAVSSQTKLEPPANKHPKLTPLKAPSVVFVPLEKRKKLDIKLKLPALSYPKSTFPSPIRLNKIILRGIFIAVALYLTTLAFTLTIASLSLHNIMGLVAKGALPANNQLNQFCVGYFRANIIALSSITGTSHTTKIKEINLLLDAYHQSLRLFHDANSLSTTTTQLSAYVLGNGSGDVASLLSSARLQSEDLYQKLSLLDGTLPPNPPSIIPTKSNESYLALKSKLTTLKKTITTARAILNITPDIIGLGGKRKYAVLFQNNMELRATGGFIGSLALLSFENGKLYDMPIYDVYDADGQLKGHVEPPLAIKDILGEANWYLRDSNFDPDFPTSARRAEWFIKKTLNQDLGGTIAVNVNTLKTLLSAIGPLDIPDYNETITKDNLYERTQFHAEVNFFPGSTQKKEFLSSVASALFVRLPNLKEGEGLRILTALTQTIDEKDTLISLTTPTTNNVLETLGWSGHIVDLPCPSASDCYKDYLMVVDSNFGVNKANYFIKRDLENIITLEKNLTISHILRIKYENTSTSTAWPSGAYKNYQRLYLPANSNVHKITLDGKELSLKDYDVSTQHNKTVVAYLAVVPIASQSLVEVAYSTPQLTGTQEPLYTWYYQKQSGTSSTDPLTVYLNYPMYLTPAVVSPTASLSTQQLKFDYTNNTDHRLTVKFAK